MMAAESIGEAILFSRNTEFQLKHGEVTKSAVPGKANECRILEMTA